MESSAGGSDCGSARKVADAFLPGGIVAGALSGFELRKEQVAMAEAVWSAFDGGGHLLVEAGTGVGKSFAYLIPAIVYATQRRCRVLVSTFTISLQEQLIKKDIPFLKRAWPEPFAAELVKGRSNYVSLRRLKRASERQGELFGGKAQLRSLQELEDWAYETLDGSLSDMPRPPDATVWDRVRSDADDCKGRQCPYVEKCFFQRARRRAEDASILVVNHAMLCSDLALRRRGVSVLPDYDCAVLDEAHTIEQVAGDHLGISVSSAQVNHLLNVLAHERGGRGILKSRNAPAASTAVEETRRVARDYMFSMQGYAESGQSTRLQEPPSGAQPMSQALLGLRRELHKLREGESDEDKRMELAAAMERCTGLARDINRWHDQEDDAWVYWVEHNARSSRTTLCSRPVNVGVELKSVLYDEMQSVVLTSATLTTSDDDGFGYMQSRLGFDEARTLHLGSPFDYRRQAKVYLPAGMPDPSNQAAFQQSVCRAIEHFVGLTDGHAFVLFTSYAMMNDCARQVKSWLEKCRMALFVQGDGLPRSRMLEQFQATPRSVLFGTDSFWAGVDVPGAALTNVIIVKLPFAVPNHPVVEARIERIQSEGGNPFMEFQVPEAVLKLKQGVGRLIRSQQDEGIIVVLDPRVTTKPYGKRFLHALPDCEVITDPVVGADVSADY